jgi:hypothetical protein
MFKLFHEFAYWFHNIKKLLIKHEYNYAIPLKPKFVNNYSIQAY